MRRTSSRNSTRDPFAFDPDRVGRAELAELGCGSFRREILRESAFDHLAQHGMQPTDRPGPSRGELVMAARQQPQDLPVILERDRPQIRCRNATIAAERASCASVLSLRPAVQQPRPCRQRGRHIDHGLARRDELLRQQRAVTGRAFDRPQPRFERCRPTQQPFALSTIGTHQQLANKLFVAVDHRGGVRSLVRVDPNDEHECPPRSAVERRGGHS